MSIEQRLNRLTPGLSAKERAILVLESWKEGREEDYQLRATMPPQQVPEFNRLIELMNGTMLRLSTYILILDAEVEKLELRQAWLVTLVLWEEQLERARLAVSQPVGETGHKPRKRASSRERTPATPLTDALTPKFSLIAKSLREGLATLFASIWQAVVAVEIVLAEVAQEFEQVYPLTPAKREELESVKSRLGKLAEELAYLGVDAQIPEPDVELTGSIRKMVDRTGSLGAS